MSGDFITIKEWTAKASKSPCMNVDGGHYYLQSAVNLALVLTKHLLDLLDSSTRSFPLEHLTLEDLTTDNLLVHLKQPVEPTGTKHYNADDQQPQVFEGVTLKAERIPPWPQHAKNGAAASASLDSSLMCIPLGNILLEMFSKGKSTCLMVMSENGMKDGSTKNSCTLGNSEACISLNENRNSEPQIDPTIEEDESDGDKEMLSIAKRMAVSMSQQTKSDSIPAKARRLLIDMSTPLSICQLVHDLLDTMNDSEPTFSSSTPTTHITLEQAFRDLTQMQRNPQTFLFDRTSPEKALKDTGLFDNADGHLFGREKEMEALMKAKDCVVQHLNSASKASNNSTTSGDDFLREAIFLGGYAGSGKSCLLRSLISSCEEDIKWFVLKCKFDSKTVPLRIVANAFNAFFGDLELRDPMAIQFFVTSFSTFDEEAFTQLCGMIPNIARICPRRAGSGSISPVERVAESSEKRLVYLINALVQTVCSLGRPVLLALDDIQWSEASILKGLVGSSSWSSFGRQGLLIAGTYRSNEVKEGDDVLENIDFLKESGKGNVTMIDVDGLSEGDITELISAKLGLPLRYTLELAKLVYRKSKGNPFFVEQFLKTIIHNKMLHFSVRSRRWTWDCDTIDFQMISDGVAALLTSSFNRLPAKLLQTLQIISLFGSQIDISTVEKMNSDQQVLSFDMEPELDMAVEEGLLEKAGPIWAFSHDLIYQTLYSLITPEQRHLLHKSVGKKLLESTDSGIVDKTMYLLAVDQINMFCKDGEPSHDERNEFAQANATAAKFAISASSFEKARSYIDMGIKLLEPDHWVEQYTLSLYLFERSASLYYMCGDTTNMSNCLDELLSHSKSFEDSLNASGMLINLLLSLSKLDDAAANCRGILAKLGEQFPQEPNLGMVEKALSEVESTLRLLTIGQMKSLPKMTDSTKLQAMKFMGMLCRISNMSTPLLLPLLSIRMIKLTLQFGMSNDSIYGLFYTAYSLHLYSDVQLGYRVGKIGESLREGSQNKHTLRSRTSLEWEGNIKLMMEPAQAVAALYPSLFESCMLAGDVHSAMMIRFSYSLLGLVIGEELSSLSKHYKLCIQQSTKHHQHTVLHIIMTSYRSFVRISGMGSNDDIKSFDQLREIGEQSHNNLLLFQVFMGELIELFWYRDYLAIAELCENYPIPKAKRIVHTMRYFYEGIAALNLARQQPHEPQYRTVGEEAVETMRKYATTNCWTYENNYLLLQAELHYLNRDLSSAENTYMEAIKSAKDHKFINEEAMSYELFGFFCIENRMTDKGKTYLFKALDLYKQWGAMNKAADLEQLMCSKALFIKQTLALC